MLMCCSTFMTNKNNMEPNTKQNRLSNYTRTRTVIQYTPDLVLVGKAVGVLTPETLFPVNAPVDILSSENMPTGVFAI